MYKKELNKLLLPLGTSLKFFQKRYIAKERSKKCYSWWDVMDIDIWFITVIINILTEFRYRHQGFPTYLFDDFYQEFDNQIKGDKEKFYCGIPDKVDKELLEMKDGWCHNKWNEIIDEMIFLFKESNEDYCSKQNPHNIETEKEQYYQTDDELYYYRKDCRKKAFELFNKHFENLWS